MFPFALCSCDGQVLLLDIFQNLFEKMSASDPLFFYQNLSRFFVCCVDMVRKSNKTSAFWLIKRLEYAELTKIEHKPRSVNGLEYLPTLISTI